MITSVRHRKHGEMKVTWVNHNLGLTEFVPGMRAQLLVNNGILFTWRHEEPEYGWKQQYVETDTFYHSIIFATDGGAFEQIEAGCGNLIIPFVTVS